MLQTRTAPTPDLAGARTIKQTEISELMNEINRQIDRIGTATENLCARLEPITTPEGEAAELDTPSGVTGFGRSLAEKIYCLHRIADRLEYCHDRIQL